MFVGVIPVSTRRLSCLDSSRIIVRKLEVIWECTDEVLRPELFRNSFLIWFQHRLGGSQTVRNCFGRLLVVTFSNQVELRVTEFRRQVFPSLGNRTRVEDLIERT